MSIVEAIEHCYEVAEKDTVMGDEAKANEHIELAHWLEELSAYMNHQHPAESTPVRTDVIQSCYVMAGRMDEMQCAMCGAQHRQIAGWLEELQSYQTN